MPKLPVIKPKELIKIAKTIGFTDEIIHDSHHIMRRLKDGKHISIPIHAGRDLKKGTLRGIITDMDLTVEEFLKLQ